MDRRNYPFCNRILSSYAGCNCTWNENDDNEESVSKDIDNSKKPDQNCRQNNGQEPRRCSLLPVEVEAEIASAKLLMDFFCWWYNTGDSLFPDNQKASKELVGTNNKDIQYSSDGPDASCNQNEDENYVTSSADRTIGDSFQHSKKQKYQCSYCPKTFPTYSKQQRHTLVHTGEFPFECKCCKRRFNQKSHLASHRGLNSERKTFKCDGCGIEFPLRCALEAHLRSERENKHFVCDFCRRKFISKRLLMDHRRSHGRERQFKCEVCGMDYVYKRGLERLKKRHH